MSDLISKQAVLKLLHSLPPEEAMTKALLIQSVKQMDAAKPERKRGKWIDYGQYADNFPHHCWQCSECNEGVIEIDTPWFKFCPNCGADMREVDDERPD